MVKSVRNREEKTIGFGFINIIRYTDEVETMCNITEVEVLSEGKSRVFVSFDIEGKLVHGSLIAVDDYPDDEVFTCYWYPRAKEISIDGGFVVRPIVQTVIGIAIAVGTVLIQIRLRKSPKCFENQESGNSINYGTPNSVAYSFSNSVGRE